MKALILASGIGSRIQDILNGLPKSLVPILGTPILDRILRDLQKEGINDVVITTGYKAEIISEHLENTDEFSSMNVEYVFNPKFAETNYIYSMWLARDVLAAEDGILLFHGDMVYDSMLLTKLIAHDTSAVFVQREGELPQKDFKACIQNGYVSKIGVDVFGEDAHACMPVYKLLQKDLLLWMEHIDEYVQNNTTDCYAENALNKILKTVQLSPLYFQDELCMEIDNADDLRFAETFLRR